MRVAGHSGAVRYASTDDTEDVLMLMTMQRGTKRAELKETFREVDEGVDGGLGKQIVVVNAVLPTFFCESLSLAVSVCVSVCLCLCLSFCLSVCVCC